MTGGRTMAAAIAAGAMAASALGASPAAAGGCTPGVKTVNGAMTRTFCGPATVSVTLAGRTFKLSQGQCARTATYLSLNIGVFTGPGAKSPRPNYFGLDVGRVPGGTGPAAGKDGTYTSGVIMSFVYGGKSNSALSATAVLAGNRTHGTVHGRTLTGQQVSATFHC
jgi:hypothetical protein